MVISRLDLADRCDGVRIKHHPLGTGMVGQPLARAGPAHWVFNRDGLSILECVVGMHPIHR